MHEILAMYTIPSIQRYIFHSNRVKEIIGASLLVQSLLEAEFLKVCEALWGEKCVFGNWTSAPDVLQFDCNDDCNDKIKVEILYYGGGNLIALFRNYEDYVSVNRLLSCRLLTKSSSLPLVSAFVDRGNNYNQDLANLKYQLERAKSRSLPLETVGNFPFTQYDPIVGEPVTNRWMNPASKKYELVSAASNCKLKKYSIEYDQKDREEYLIFDDMVTQKDEDSYLALIHLDGNSMGNFFNALTIGKDDYAGAVHALRKASASVKQIFNDSGVDTIHNTARGRLSGEKLQVRTIINNGDDVTLVCNPHLAFDIVENYLKMITSHAKSEKAEYGNFSACAGIAIFHSHYPFSLAYDIAEECCKHAKAAAKESCKDPNQCGSYLDFHYCYSGRVQSLDAIRERYYKNKEGCNLLQRPFQVIGDDETHMTWSEIKAMIQQMSEWPRSRIQDLLKSYQTTSSQAEAVYSLAKMRKYHLPVVDGSDQLFNNGQAVYFDALELWDLLKEE